MSQPAIQVEGLGKQYRGGVTSRGYSTFRDTITRSVRRLTGGNPQPASLPFWALRDVDFSIPQGEVTGIIGRNGAGKSTLLKILARITEPTTGKVEIRGRLGSLLEVGTGFHPELSGRENIYLNGAILGMRRAEIERKFDEIVAFAEQEAFIDTPVKHYSSGMYMRLAFSVAAHLEPDILLVDEVLAVGDAAFQKKCLGKMGDITREGRTILFVSHDVTSIAVLCRSAILLDSGQMRSHGPVGKVLDEYLGAGTDDCTSLEWTPEDAPGDDTAKILGLRLLMSDGGQAGMFTTSDSIILEMEYVVLQPDARLNPVIGVRNSRGILLFTTANYGDPEWCTRHHEPGVFRTRCTIPANLLNNESYSVNAYVIGNMRTVCALVEEKLRFSVTDDGTSRGDYTGDWRGVVRPKCFWSTERISLSQ